MKLRYRDGDGWYRTVDTEEVHLALWAKDGPDWIEAEARDAEGQMMMTKWNGPLPVDYLYSLKDSFIEKHGKVRGSE